MLPNTLLFREYLFAGSYSLSLNSVVGTILVTIYRYQPLALLYNHKFHDVFLQLSSSDMHLLLQATANILFQMFFHLKYYRLPEYIFEPHVSLLQNPPPFIKFSHIYLISSPTQLQINNIFRKLFQSPCFVYH